MSQQQQKTRVALGRALAVIHVTRLSLTSQTDGYDPDATADALDLVHELIADAAEALERPPRALGRARGAPP